MKKTYLFLALFCICATYSFNIFGQNAPKPVVIAYTMRGPIPDPTYVTHFNYAFGHVNNTFDGIRINSEERLMEVSNLKKQKPDLKVLLSIGGWGSGRFSEMAADPNYRKAFVADCQRVIDQFNLDGVDLDWEYPTSTMGNISASPDDTKNFTILMREIREKIGKDKLLTFASSANARYVDFKAIEPYVDFVNIMTYDMGTPPNHHSALFKSEHSTLSCEESVNLHIAAGIPPHKLVLGVPFYGKARQNSNSQEARQFPRFWQVRDQNTYREQWDDIAKVPYLTNAEGEFVYTYENPRSIVLKCEFLKERGLLGAMYWEFSQDDYLGTMQKTVFEGVMK